MPNKPTKQREELMTLLTSESGCWFLGAVALSLVVSFAWLNITYMSSGERERLRQNRKELHKAPSPSSKKKQISVVV